MFGSDALETTFWLVLVYSVLAAACIVAVEGIDLVANRRGWYLSKALTAALDERLATALFEHPLVRAPGRRRMPSHLPPSFVAAALVEIVGPSRDLRFLSALALVNRPKVGADSVSFTRSTVERWYIELTHQASRAFRREAQIILLLFATALALFFNVNTVRILNRPSLKPVVEVIRERALPSAVKPAQDGTQSPTTSPSKSPEVADALPQLRNLAVDLQVVQYQGFHYPGDLPGCLLTALVVCSLSSLLFGVLTRAVSVRSAPFEEEKVAHTASTPRKRVSS